MRCAINLIRCIVGSLVPSDTRRVLSLFLSYPTNISRATLSLPACAQEHVLFPSIRMLLKGISFRHTLFERFKELSSTVLYILACALHSYSHSHSYIRTMQEKEFSFANAICYSHVHVYGGLVGVHFSAAFQLGGDTAN